MRGEEIAYLGYQTGEVEYINIDRYPDGSPLVKHELKAFPCRILLRPRDSAGFLGGLFWVQSLIEQGVRPMELVIPCVFGQRQDRINPTGDTLFTIKSVGKLINSLGVPRVHILDPHSEATQASIDRAAVYHVDDIFRAFRPSCQDNFYAAVIAPDAGAAKRAGKIAKFLGVPLKQAWKNRDVKDGKITGFGIENCDDLFDTVARQEGDEVPRVLVVDDLCDAGGTFIGLGQVLDEQGFDSDLYVTHGLFTKGTRDLLVWYRSIACTDSVVTQRPDVHIFSAADRILRHGDLA